MTRTEDTRDAGVVHYDTNRDAWVYRASGLGSCLGALVRARMGVDADAPPDWLMERYEEGIRFEDEILATVEEHGWGLYRGDELAEVGAVDGLGQLELEIKVPVGGGQFAYVVVHPDGVTGGGSGEGSDGVMPVEAKATSPDYAKAIRRELPRLYAWQVSVEAVALHTDKVLFVVGEKVANEDRSIVTLGDVSVDVLTVPYTRADIMKRVIAVERMVAGNEVPNCEYRMYPCGFFTDHDPDDPLWGEDAEVEVPEEDVDSWDYAVDDFVTLHEAEKEIKGDKKKAAEKVGGFFEKWGAKGLSAQSRGRKVRDVVQKRRGAVDLQKFLGDKGMEYDEEELNAYRSEYEVRYPMVKQTKKDGE